MVTDDEEESLEQRARRLIDNAQLNQDYDPELGLAPLYDFYLSLRRGGFLEKQALWLVGSVIFGNYNDLGIVDGPTEAPSS